MTVKYKIARILILIPYMVLITEIVLLLLSLFGAYFNNIRFSSVFFAYYFYLIFFATYPCLICSVIGFVLTIVLMKNEKLKSKKLILLGFFSILVSILLYLWNTWYISGMMSV